MATHSSILAWKIPWIEESGRLQSMGSQRVGHDWSDLAYMNAWFKIILYSVKYLLRVNKMFLLPKFWKWFSKILWNFILISVWGSYWSVTNTIIFSDFAFIMQNSKSFEWFLWVLSAIISPGNVLTLTINWNGWSLCMKHKHGNLLVRCCNS